jgi:tetratricopeptide (TPR) repeat protein
MKAATFHPVRLVLFFLCSLSVPRAEGGDGFRAFGDSSAPLDDRQVQSGLEILTPRLNMDGEVTDFDRAQPASSSASSSSSASASADASAASMKSLPAAVLAQLKGSYEQSINGLQQQLARLKPKDAANRATLENSLAQTVNTYRGMFGTLPPGFTSAPATSAAAAAANPSTYAKPTLKRPVTGNRALTLLQALSSLRKMLEENSPAEARAAFATSREYNDADKCGEVAAGALVMKRVTAALAALLRAQELAPKNPAHLINLAGITSRVGLPRHTLALLDAADKLGTPPKVFGLDGHAVSLTNRGHALIQLKRFPEAETALREAVRRAPELAEARENLAHALYQQNNDRKKEEARETMRFARWRKAQPPSTEAPAQSPSTSANPVPATPSSPAKPAEDERGLSDADFNSQRHGRPPAEAVFNLSRGKSGGLPTIKSPRTIQDGHELYPKLLKFEHELHARESAIVGRINELDTLLRRRERSGQVSSASASRARDVFWYIGMTHTEPRYRSLWREVVLASREPGNGLTGGQWENPWGSKELQENYDRISHAGMKYPAYCKAMFAATEPFQATWQGPIHRIETAINRYYHVTYPHMTALAANLADPLNHEYAMLLIEQRGLALMHDLTGPLHTVCFFNKFCVEAWGDQGKEGTSEEPTPGNFTDADFCSAISEAGYKASFDLEVISISINCEAISTEISAGEWVKLFAEVECTFDGEVTVFIGGAGEAEIPIVGPISTEAKAGAFIKIDFNTGVVDAGVKTSESTSVKVGPVAIEHELEQSYVIATF